MIQDAFLDRLKEISSVFLIGGCVRNSLYGIPIKDIDCIVFNVKDENLFEDLLLDCVKNRFGGWRYSGDINVDFWKLEDSYNGQYDFKIPEDILDYVIFNMDAILYDIDNQKYIKHDAYKQFEQKQIVDFLNMDLKHYDKQVNKIKRYQRYFNISDTLKKLIEKNGDNNC